MNLNQVHALAVVAFFLASVLTALWGTEIAGAAAGAWARGSAQAAAERRRFGGAAREARERNSGGRGMSGAWQQAAGAARGMRGAARGASAWARQEGGPVRRVAAATATGAFLGARGAARAAAGARRKAAASGAAGGGGSSGRGGSSGPGRRSWTGGTRRHGDTTGTAGAAGSRPRSGWRPRQLGVCDECGVTVARASLKPVTAQGTGGGRQRQACFLCRSKRGPQAPAGAGSPTAGRAPAGAPLPANTSAAPAVTPPPAVPLPHGGSTGTGPVPAAQPRPLLTASSVTTTSGQVPELAGVPAAPQPSITGGTEMTAAAIGSARPGSALAVRPGGQAAIQGRVTGPPGSRVAVRPASPVAIGDATTHGEWVSNVEVVVMSLARLFVFANQMIDDLTTADGPDGLINDTCDWADQINVKGTQILNELMQVDGNLAGYIDAVMAAGGPAEIASPAWHDDY